ncbi:hypothetical protein EJ04DRAFT_505411 [Polyplosphaeria fusca]|uniref:Uncharacterized protein n=1 Tax=Polyplosphaeria fusca TaxID=682080 RepID=A0A9P4QHY4_9PLEO|nr:hypothetical protein EJ04DRAFT_505411 [Polyplosphaeria fusca]
MNLTSPHPPFTISHLLSTHHLLPLPSDLALSPPPTYLLIQDFLILSCGILYALCYLFYATRTYTDRHLSGTVYYLATTMSYELYYAFVMTTGGVERAGFLVWFCMDVAFASVAIAWAYQEQRKWGVVVRLAMGVVGGVGVFWGLGKVWPSEREQLTAYWTGIALQLPISVGHVVLLIRERSTKGQSVEMWITRYLGCYTAYGVFWWRWLNVPENWGYVGSFWSWFIIGVTLAAETVWPFVYVWVHWEERRGKVKKA